MQAQKRRLGRGLAALIGDDTTEEAVVQDVRNLRHLPVDLIHANPANPRKVFKEEDLDDLARSIKEKGLLQPLVVRHRPDGEFEIVAGERRWRAAQRVGIHELPVLIRDMGDGEALEIALIENIQRADLNAIEEARGYQQLIDQFDYTQNQLAESVGKSRSHIANTLRLLALPDKVRTYIEQGILTAGHARTLVATDSPEQLAQQIIALGLTVRGAEELSRQHTAGGETGQIRAAREKSADTRALEKDLSDALGLKVDIADKGQSGGSLSIKYSNLEQLDDICLRLRHRAN